MRGSRLFGIVALTGFVTTSVIAGAQTSAVQTPQVKAASAPTDAGAPVSSRRDANRTVQKM